MATKSFTRPSFFSFLLLFTVWLLLTYSFTIGNILLALVLALLIPRFVARFQTHYVRVQNHRKAFVYILRLLLDVTVSSFVVAKQVLGPIDQMKPGFVTVPLDMTDPLPITFLASTISLTPGTVSAELSADRQFLFVHTLHVEDEAAFIAEIKTRYETPLKEIFGC